MRNARDAHRSSAAGYAILNDHRAVGRALDAPKGGFYHDGRFATLSDVVKHYNTHFNLNLSDSQQSDLIEYLKTDFDTIILDAPPFSPIADARIVTALSDGFILVIRRGKTSYRSIEGAYRVIDRQKLLGVVFNDVKPMLFHTYYNRGYYNYSHDSQYLYPSRKTRVNPKNYLES